MKPQSINLNHPLIAVVAFGLLWYGGITLLKANVISPGSFIIMTTLLSVWRKANKILRRGKTDSSDNK